jgi:predicted ester cyclase
MSAVAPALRSIEIIAGVGRTPLARVIHPEFVSRGATDEPPASRHERGPAAVRATVRWRQAAYSELRWEVDEIVAERDLVVVHGTISGRHTGDFVAYGDDAEIAAVFPPTGRRFESAETHWLRIADGKVVEHWVKRDDLGIAKQLGRLAPSPLYRLRMALAKRRARPRRGIREDPSWTAIWGGLPLDYRAGL